MLCIVLFGNEEFAGAGVIKTCCCAKEKTHLMPWLFIPVGQGKAHVSELTQVMPRTTGLYTSVAPMGWHSTALPWLDSLSWVGGWEKVPLCSVCSCPCACAGPSCSHPVQHGRRKFPSGVPFHQASPAGSPWSHQNCHLSYSTGLVQAITHVLHTLPFLMYFPVGSAPASAFSTTNLHVHHIFALKLIIAAPQTVPEGWGRAAAKPRAPLLPLVPSCLFLPSLSTGTGESVCGHLVNAVMDLAEN